jgi:hypothetical protein
MASQEDVSAVGDDPNATGDGSSVASEARTGQPSGTRGGSARVLWLAVGVALAHLALVLVEPDPAPIELAGFELAVLLVVGLVDLLSDPGRRVFRPVILASVFAGLVGATWLALGRFSPALTAVGGGLAVTLIAYALHRYRLVTLARAEGSDEL